MTRRFRVYYNHQSDFGPAWSSDSRCFNDWFEFADWLKQLNEAGKAVLITKWYYV